jgi:hypothetical protein
MLLVGKVSIGGTAVDEMSSEPFDEAVVHLLLLLLLLFISVIYYC